MDESCLRATLFVKVGIETKKLTKTSVENFELKEKKMKLKTKTMMMMVTKVMMMMMMMMMMTFRQK